MTTGAAAYCWGNSTFGQLGNGSTTNSSIPVLVSGGLGFAALSTGSGHTCGVTSSGAAYCWGFNADGQLGNGTTTVRAVPTKVAGQP
jgi:alpha-tubulin suppressor-like RCC1 family protein